MTFESFDKCGKVQREIKIENVESKIIALAIWILIDSPDECGQTGKNKTY